MGEKELHHIYKEVEKELQEWLDDTVLMLSKQLAKKKINITGSLLNSIRQELISNGQQGFHTAAISFKIYGKYLELKNLDFSDIQSGDIYYEWVKKKGLSRFSSVSGYNNKPTKLPTEKQLYRIAWAIAKSRENGLYNKKTRKWYSKPLYASMAAVSGKIASIYTESAPDFIFKI